MKPKLIRRSRPKLKATIHGPLAGLTKGFVIHADACVSALVELDEREMQANNPQAVVDLVKVKKLAAVEKLEIFIYGDAQQAIREAIEAIDAGHLGRAKIKLAKALRRMTVSA